MKFPFKTLEQQLKESGFDFIGNFPVCEFDQNTFPDYKMKYIGERLIEWQKIKKKYFDQVFLRVRPMRDGEQAGGSDYRKQKVIELYVAR